MPFSSPDIPSGTARTCRGRRICPGRGWHGRKAPSDILSAGGCCPALPRPHERPPCCSRRCSYRDCRCGSLRRRPPRPCWDWPTIDCRRRGTGPSAPRGSSPGTRGMPGLAWARVGRSGPEHLVRGRGRLAPELAEIALLRLHGRLVQQLGLDLAFDHPQVVHRHPVGQVQVLEHPVGQLQGCCTALAIAFLMVAAPSLYFCLAVGQRLGALAMWHQGVVGVEVVAAAPDVLVLLARGGRASSGCRCSRERRVLVDLHPGPSLTSAGT